MFGQGYMSSFLGGMLSHLDAAKRERMREQYGITNENGYDGVSRVNIPHQFNKITVKNDCFYCEINRILTVYDMDGKKLFTSNDIKHAGGDMYFVKIIDEDIAEQDWGYALYRNEEKLTDDIFRTYWMDNGFNEAGLIICGLSDERYVKVVLNKDGDVIYTEKESYSRDITLYGVVLETKEGYLNLLTNKYICGKSHYSSDVMDNEECIFVRTEKKCIYQINMMSGEFILHGSEKEKEKPLTEEEKTEAEAEYERKDKERKVGLNKRIAEEKEWNKLSRNESCRCGSGRKFKNCCISTWKSKLANG